MYDLDLTTSHAQPQSDIETRDITIGALLREVAAARPEAEALVEVKQNGTKRAPLDLCRTYAKC